MTDYAFELPWYWSIGWASDDNLNFQLPTDFIMSRTRQGTSASTEEGSIFRIPPYFYLHVFDQTTNVTKVELGPKTFIRQDNEKVWSKYCCFSRV